MWEDINQHLKNELNNISHIIIWAGGIHTSQLLANTDLEFITAIDYVVDMDPQKESLKIGKYIIRNPDTINFSDPTLGIVISSFEAENDIYENIISKKNLKSRVIKLHDK